MRSSPKYNHREKRERHDKNLFQISQRGEGVGEVQVKIEQYVDSRLPIKLANSGHVFSTVWLKANGQQDRTGGSKFSLLLPNPTGKPDAIGVTTTIRGTVKAIRVQKPTGST